MTEPKFMTPAHRRAYLTHLNRCKAMDSYHRALIYILTAVPALRWIPVPCVATLPRPRAVHRIRPT